MAALRLTTRLAAFKNVSLFSASLHLVSRHNSSPSLNLRSKERIPQIAGRLFHYTATRCISQASNDKDSEWQDLVTSHRTIEARVVKITAEQLGVKEEEVCTR
jgi:hypothetical protein